MNALEIEIKARCEDIEAVLARARSLGAVESGVFDEEDRYYNHPSRDFAKTDEAFRIRRCNELSLVTYKGPKRPGLSAKTRTEVELGIDDPEKFALMLRHLGFSETGLVRKRRRIFRLGESEICFDRVEGLGDFVEIERLGTDADAIEKELLDLAAELGLSGFERRSYLELLLES